MSLVTEIQALSTRIATETKTLKDQGGGGSSPVTPTKKAMFSFGGAGAGNGTMGSFNTLNIRMPFSIPVSSTRWRLRIINRNADGTSPSNSTVNVTGVWLGKANYDAAGNPNGTFDAANAALGAFTFDGATEYVSAWVTAPNLQLSAVDTYVLSMGVTGSSTTGITYGYGAGWLTFNAADATAFATVPSAGNGSRYDTKIEYEFTGTNKIGVAIGDSLTEGMYGDANTVWHHCTWHQLASQKAEIPITASGWYGSNLANWASASQWSYSRWSSVITPDFAVIHLGTNDVGLNPGLATIQSRYGVVINNLRSLGIKTIYLTTLAPRNTTGAVETLRLQVNDWLRTRPFGVEATFDVARAIENPTNPANSQTGMISTSDLIHYSPLGHNAAGNAVDLSPSTGSAGFEANLATEYNDSNTGPSAPATGIKLFARRRARATLSVIGPTGQDTALQPALFSNRVARLNVVNNVAAPVLDGLAVTPTTTPTLVPVATTNFYTSMVRHRYTSSATAGTAAGTRSTTAQWFLSSTPNLGGFFFVARLGLQAVTATNRLFVGMSTTTAALSPTVEPTAYLNMVGFGANSTNTTWHFMCNDGSGTATAVNLGTNFRTNVAATDFYEFRLFAPSGGGSQVHWSAQRLNDGAMATGTATADLPALNTLMSAHVVHSNGTTAAAASLDLQSLYIETDN